MQSEYDALTPYLTMKNNAYSYSHEKGTKYD